MSILDVTKKLGSGKNFTDVVIGPMRSCPSCSGIEKQRAEKRAPGRWPAPRRTRHVEPGLRLNLRTDTKCRHCGADLPPVPPSAPFDGSLFKKLSP
jgi:hypothetical protein